MRRARCGAGKYRSSRMDHYEEWVTQSFKLLWERDDWRLAAESDAPGPRPDPGRQSPATAAELDSRLVGFEAVA